MNVDGLVAIDCHVHVEVSPDGATSLPAAFLEASERYFKVQGNRALTVDEIAAYYRERRMGAVVFTVDAESTLGHPPLSSEAIADAAARHRDVLVPFASVDPRRGADGVALARRLVEEHAVRGFKFHPILQAFQPNDPLAYPLYEALQELGVVALFHSGQSGIGAGMRGGAGLRLKYGNPIALDDVAADFPDLRIVIAHPSFPWQDEALAVALHKPNVYLDLSGWSPRYFPPQLIRYANGQLRDRVLFGSDFPLIAPERWLADFEKLEMKPEVRPLILKENVARLLQLRTRDA